MVRPLRIEYAGALYHITSRGNARQDIYFDSDDWNKFLEVLAKTIERNNWCCHSYCLMSNHYHLVIEINSETLSKGMRYLNGVYSQYVNKRYKRIGHLFQGRYKAILVEKESYLQELARYTVLNPVRAGMVEAPEDWCWSSYRAMAGLANKPDWLTTDWILSFFDKSRSKAVIRYCRFVNEGVGKASPWSELVSQIYLGSDTFVEHAQCQIKVTDTLDNVSKPQKGMTKKPLGYFDKLGLNRDETMKAAYLTGCYTMKEIGDYFNVSHMTVSRAVNKNVKC